MKATWKGTNAPVTPADLKANGIEYQHIGTVDYQAKLDQYKKENSYNSQDIVELNPGTPNLETILAKFDKEHLHTDDEVRFVLDGSGVFEIRSIDDRWMHVLVEKGDYISVPANRYHLFYTTEDKFIRCVRLFKENPSWVPLYRAELEKTTAQA